MPGKDDGGDTCLGTNPGNRSSEIAPVAGRAGPVVVEPGVGVVVGLPRLVSGLNKPSNVEVR